jgi:probable HAF family extracellular repeat protein
VLEQKTGLNHNGCDRAIPSPNRLTERFAYKIKRLLKNVALLYSPGSHANGINDAGTIIVGTYVDTSGTAHGFMWP